MSLSGEQEQQLLALIGRVADLEQYKKSQEDLNRLESSIKSWAEMLVPIGKAANVSTLDDNYRISDNDPALHVLDCGGSMRTVYLPDAGNSNKMYVILNKST